MGEGGRTGRRMSIHFASEKRRRNGLGEGRACKGLKMHLCEGHGRRLGFPGRKTCAKTVGEFNQAPTPQIGRAHV